MPLTTVWLQMKAQTLHYRLTHPVLAIAMYPTGIDLHTVIVFTITAFVDTLTTVCYCNSMVKRHHSWGFQQWVPTP